MQQSKPVMTSKDTSAEAFAELGNETRRRLSEKLYETLRHAHQQGVRDMSRRELRDYYNQQTGVWLELCSVASTVNALLAAGRLEEGAARRCSVSPRQRDVVPVKCKAKQQAIA
ncbi:hypothetical protein QYQ99_03690 [Comamonas testosteroni]|uniref:hypothetical protein n=1 Tax=Comamonas testosteroni TaxID=285 RepID=UPI00265FCC03|nr:hypothetical protein [Comamonas testosteroni]WKL16670.1 hypothetical protein QYQ99_03690 [Comamonas testosteroni]